MPPTAQRAATIILACIATGILAAGEFSPTLALSRPGSTMADLIKQTRLVACPEPVLSLNGFASTCSYANIFSGDCRQRAQRARRVERNALTSIPDISSLLPFLSQARYAAFCTRAVAPDRSHRLMVRVNGSGLDCYLSNAVMNTPRVAPALATTAARRITGTPLRNSNPSHRPSRGLRFAKSGFPIRPIAGCGNSWRQG
ncbi:hypothetical protein P3T18_003110 [Paraburkholderia sp. GAS199]